MRIARWKIQSLPTTILIVVGLLVWVLSCGDVAFAFDFHADSAHGNTTDGVNRSSKDYPTGDCANCHETFDDSTCGVNNFLLWYDDYVSQGDLFCYGCHSSVPIVEQPVTNYPYCVTFGGRAAFYVNIRNQFYNANSGPGRCGSRHLLSRIRYVIEDNAYDWGFNSDPDPCVACHNPHAAQKNHPVAIDGEGKLNTAIRRPSHYKSTDPQDFLWGDDEGERMFDYASSLGGTYQPPYHGDTTSGRYEPTGTTTDYGGTRTPDYVTFCMDCHINAQYDPENSVWLEAINWTLERHGTYPSNDTEACTGFPEGSLRPPYFDSPNSNYILSCLDCHEPHATHSRTYLIRRMINGEAVASEYPTCDESEDWITVCERCHNLGVGHGGTCITYDCHGHGNTWVNIWPCNNKPMF